MDIVIHADDEALANMPDVVTKMHAASGLTEEVRASTVTLAEAEEQVLDYIRRHVTTAGQVPLAGNSIATDRAFLARDMPKLDTYLHYRMVDVSSIKELCRRWYPKIYFGQPAKGLSTVRSPISASRSRVEVLPRGGVRAATRARRRRAHHHRRGSGPGVGNRLVFSAGHPLE